MSAGEKLLPCPRCGMAAVVPADGDDHPCASCGAPLRVDVEADPATPSLVTALRYPFTRGSAVAFLALLAPVWGAVRALGMSLIDGLGERILGHGGVFLGVLLMALFGGYAAVWLWDILETTAAGSDAPPSTPWPGEFWEWGRPFARFVAAFATAFAPALLARWLLGVDAPWKGAISSGLALAGMAYYPMAILLVGFSADWTGALRLPTAFRSIRVLGSDYALCCVFIGVSFGLSTAVEFGVAAVWTHVGPWPGLAGTIVAVFLELALYAIHMRAIGLVYRARRKDLGWFR
ncbi:MAG TPA: hypothetical protein VF950_08850 [Planctomycetota bacterium]